MFFRIIRIVHVLCVLFFSRLSDLNECQHFVQDFMMRWFIWWKSARAYSYRQIYTSVCKMYMYVEMVMCAAHMYT